MAERAEQRESRSYGSKYSLRRRAMCKIVVDGQDVTRAIDPHLLSVQTITRLGDMNEADVATIELDDREGRLAIPPADAPIEISLGWQNESMGLVWEGFVQDVESGFSRRGGGRRLWLDAKGFDDYGLKTAHFRHAWGDGMGREIPLEEVMGDAARAAGLSIKISPSMRDIRRKYWAQNESFLHFGWRLAKELGGAFKVEGDTATLVNITDGLNTDGEAMQTVEAIWGENLISWRIKPFSAAPQKGKAATGVDNREKGQWEEYVKPIEGELPFGITESLASLPAPAATPVSAEQWNVGLAEGSMANRGIGTIVITGEPAAQIQGRVEVRGARAGVDGIYLIDEVEHVYSRTAGYVTTISCKFPAFGTGVYGEAWDWVKGRVKREAVPEPIPTRWGVEV